MLQLLDSVVARAGRFLARQKRNYKVAVVRSASSSFLTNLTAQYDPIYTTALGADPVQLGSISSVGAGISALISMPVGWLVDRYGFKRFHVLGVGLLSGGALIYALAHDWHILIAAMILLTVSMRWPTIGIYLSPP